MEWISETVSDLRCRPNSIATRHRISSSAQIFNPSIPLGRTGIVTMADVTGATPAVQGAYSAFRQTRFEIARQYFENPMLAGRPAFDVILGSESRQHADRRFCRP
jgi:hypothetical protein